MSDIRFFDFSDVNVKVLIEGFSHRGRLRVNHGSNPTLEVVYSHDRNLSTDPSSDEGFIEPGKTGYGISHEINEAFTITGSILDETQFEFSLFVLENKTSELLDVWDGTFLVKDIFEFKYAIIGDTANHLSTSFNQFNFSFYEISNSHSFSRLGIDLVNRTEKQTLSLMSLSASEQLWSIELNEGIYLSLNVGVEVSAPMNGYELYSVYKKHHFSIYVEAESFSLATALNLIDAIANLISISFGVRVFLTDLDLISNEGEESSLFSSSIIEDNVGDRYIDQAGIYFLLERLTPEDYKKWLVVYPDIKFFSQLLVNRSFSGSHNELVLGKLITQLESLYLATTTDTPKSNEFGRQVKSLLIQNRGSKTVLSKLDAKSISTRILDVRTLLNHKVLDHLSQTGHEELNAIFELTKLIYVAALMKKAKIAWEEKLDNHSYPGKITDRVSHLLKLHFGRWEKLDEIRQESVSRVSGKTVKDQSEIN